jgi:hypothetical protein
MVMKNRAMIVLIGIFFVGFGFAVDSSSETDFSIDGCDFIFEGVSDDIYPGECSSGVAQGYFFCQAGTPTYLWKTREEGLGCSMGSTSYVMGDEDCCPAGTFCNVTDSGLFRCDRRLENCEDQRSEGDCKNNGCSWMDITSECVDNPRDYDCGYYNSNTTCEADRWDLGSTGVGTEICGSFIECNGERFTVPRSSCGCGWFPDAPEGDKCQFNVTATQTQYMGTPDRFSCSNVYELGECIGGERNVSWYSSNETISGFTSTGGVIPEVCLDALGCNGGETSQFCGEEIIKLPGISFFSLFASLVIIGFYYFRVGRKGGFELL